MKPLLNTLFIDQDKAYLSLDGETIVVKKEDDTIARLPLHNFEQITVFGYTGASPALMRKCAENNIGLVFMGTDGRFQARVIGKSNGNVLLRKAQYRVSDDAAFCLRLAKLFITGKIYNTRWVIERMLRDHPMRIDTAKFNEISCNLKKLYQSIAAVSNSEELLGIEGKAAVIYFSIFDDMLLNQKEEFFFTERNRRPPLDNVNCMLSFGYALLANDVASALEGVGLDSYVGFMHRDRPGRISLALDIMEELRAVMVDRLVLSLVNTKTINGKSFIKEDSGAVILTDEGRKIILKAWHDRKEEMLTHPYLNEKIKWGLVPHAQAMLLARYLRGDIENYPVFLWK